MCLFFLNNNNSCRPTQIVSFSFSLFLSDCGRGRSMPMIWTGLFILDKIDTHSLNGFTNYVKLFLLQTYQDTCTVPNCYICSLSNTLNT